MAFISAVLESKVASNRDLTVLRYYGTLLAIFSSLILRLREIALLLHVRL